jgi:fibronectin type 3 domain-containing protein
MKKLIIILLLLLLPLNAFASKNVTLKWDHEDPNSISYYTVYYSVNRSGPPYQNHVQAKTESANVDIDPNTGIYYFAVTAIDKIGLESEYSNEISVKIPKAPKDLRIFITLEF